MIPKLSQNNAQNNYFIVKKYLQYKLPAVLPDNAAIDVRQYSTAEALFLIANSLYATISPDFNSRVFTRFAAIIL